MSSLLSSATRAAVVGVSAASALGVANALNASPIETPVWHLVDLTKHNMDHHLLHSALSGEDKLEKYDLYLDSQKQNLRAVARLGDKACGHPRIVHGGAIASLLDDAFGSLFFCFTCRERFHRELNSQLPSAPPSGNRSTHIDANRPHRRAKGALIERYECLRLKSG